MGPRADRVLLGAAFLVLTATPVVAGEAGDWLVRMDRALRELDYEGRLVYVHGAAVQALQITHSAAGGQERLVALNGPIREVTRDDAELVCPVPEVGTVAMARPDVRGGGRGLLAVDPAHLGEAYEARLEGEARVAGRDALVVALVPKDRLRYGHRLFLDAESALPLKADLLDEAGMPRTQVMFVSFEVRRGGKPASESPVPSAPPIQDATPLPLRLSSLPKGFRLAASARRPLPGSGRELHYAVFSDGATSVSLYVASPGHHDLQGRAEVGPVNAVGRRVGAYQVTAMGEVPPATLEAFVGAVDPAKGAQ